MSFWDTIIHSCNSANGTLVLKFVHWLLATSLIYLAGLYRQTFWCCLVFDWRQLLKWFLAVDPSSNKTFEVLLLCIRYVTSIFRNRLRIILEWIIRYPLQNLIGTDTSTLALDLWIYSQRDVVKVQVKIVLARIYFCKANPTEDTKTKISLFLLLP